MDAREIELEDRLADSYDKLWYAPPLMKMMHDDHAKMINSNDDESVLEIGCGTGCTLQNVRGKRYGIDPSPRMIEQTLERNMVCFVASADAIPSPDNLFDKTFFHATLHHIPDKDTALKEAKRVTKPGGKVIIIDMVKEEPIRLKALHGLFYPLQFAVMTKNKKKIQERDKIIKSFGSSPYHEPIEFDKSLKHRYMNPLITHFEGLLFDGKTDKAIASFIFKTDKVLGNIVGGYGVCIEIPK